MFSNPIGKSLPGDLFIIIVVITRHVSPQKVWGWRKYGGLIEGRGGGGGGSDPPEGCSGDHHASSPECLVDTLTNSLHLFTI